ncbi:hypothetical protein MSM1_19505 [Mycobacterium sp. SM1]|uniref:hypothetical protein n=1 Tax=Mycobacterium sp. SM1 TaxID=2816243 RepID=UPI001BCDDAAE|nr:hypothetical protein [Mycobacterium sp. SM1]MBS4730415.1 hypothetical protein [Mycobacterium sp. SM1]
MTSDGFEEQLQAADLCGSGDRRDRLGGQPGEKPFQRGAIDIGEAGDIGSGGEELAESGECVQVADDGFDVASAR